jgi:hypothetical protein
MKFRQLAVLAALALIGAFSLAQAASLRQNPDGSMSVFSDVTGVEATRAGGGKAIGGPGAGVSVPDFRPGSALKIGPFAGVVATTGGAIGAWTNNLGYDIIIEYADFDVTTASSGAANLTVGQTPTSVTTAASNIIAAVSVASTGGKASAAALGIKVKAGEFVTLQGSADTSGLVGSLYLRFIPA